MPPARRNKGTAVERVADKFGGFGPFARLLGLHESAVRQWNMDKAVNRRGRDGSIPDAYHKKIVALAKKHRVKLRVSEMVNV